MKLHYIMDKHNHGTNNRVMSINIRENDYNRCSDVMIFLRQDSSGTCLTKLVRDLTKLSLSQGSP